MVAIYGVNFGIVKDGIKPEYLAASKKISEKFGKLKIIYYICIYQYELILLKIRYKKKV